MLAAFELCENKQRVKRAKANMRQKFGGDRLHETLAETVQNGMCGSAYCEFIVRSGLWLL